MLLAAAAAALLVVALLSLFGNDTSARKATSDSVTKRGAAGGGRVVVEGEEQEGADSELQLDAGEVMRPKGPIDAVLEFPNAGGARVDVATGAEVTGLSADGEERAPSAEKAAGLYLRVGRGSQPWRRTSQCGPLWRMSRVAPEVSSPCVSCSMDQRRHAQDGAPLKCGLSMVRTWSGWVPVRECASTVG